jgi:hypothetical protein
MTNEINVNQDMPNIISGTFTTTQQSPDVNNPYWQGCVVYLNITSASGTGGLTPHLMFKDPGSGQYDDMAAMGSAKTANGIYAYLIYPASGLLNDGGASQTAALPRTFAIKIVAGDNSSYTYSVSLSLIR